MARKKKNKNKGASNNETLSASSSSAALEDGNQQEEIIAEPSSTMLDEGIESNRTVQSSTIINPYDDPVEELQDNIGNTVDISEPIQPHHTESMIYQVESTPQFENSWIQQTISQEFSSPFEHNLPEPVGDDWMNETNEQTQHTEPNHHYNQKISHEEIEIEEEPIVSQPTKLQKEHSISSINSLTIQTNHEDKQNDDLEIEEGKTVEERASSLENRSFIKKFCDLFLAFFPFGFISFGGPIANVGLLGKFSFTNILTP